MFCFCFSIYYIFYLSLYIYKETFRVNKYKKQICYKEHKPLFFGVMNNGQTFCVNVCHFQYHYRFFFSREMGNIRTCQEIRLQKLYYISVVRIVFVLAFIELLINEESFGSNFSLSFAAKYFDRNFKYLFQKLSNFLYIVLCHFLMS